jgi:hypothetical protein
LTSQEAADDENFNRPRRAGGLGPAKALNHGYVSHAQSQDGILVDDMGDPASDGPVAKG